MSKSESLSTGKLIKALENIQSYDDRATAIVGAAILENILTIMLERYLIDDEKAKKQFLDMEFSRKSSLALCLGLISPNENNDIRQIVSIRNHFAHMIGVNDFQDELLSKDFKSFKLTQKIGVAGKSNREIFLIIINLFVIQFFYRCIKINHCEIREDINYEVLAEKFRKIVSGFAKFGEFIIKIVKTG